MSESISVVIPVAKGDLAWQRLLPLLEPQSPALDICLSVSDAATEEEKLLYQAAAARHEKVRVCRGPSGRAQQINRGIVGAKASWVWVLHADSHFQDRIWSPLLRALKNSPEALHYFDLSFADGGKRMLLNSWGVRWRSQIFGMPFGDQGFLFQKRLWEELGGFPEQLAYGEDHLFIWHWRQRGWKIRRIPENIETSARKYIRNGWLHTSLRHGYLTWKQAIPEVWRLWAIRVNSRREEGKRQDYER